MTFSLAQIAECAVSWGRQDPKGCVVARVESSLAGIYSLNPLCLRCLLMVAVHMPTHSRTLHLWELTAISAMAKAERRCRPLFASQASATRHALAQAVTERGCQAC